MLSTPLFRLLAFPALLGRSNNPGAPLHDEAKRNRPESVERDADCGNVSTEFPSPQLTCFFTPFCRPLLEARTMAYRELKRAML
jgi:hypothetical protein